MGVGITAREPEVYTVIAEYAARNPFLGAMQLLTRAPIEPITRAGLLLDLLEDSIGHTRFTAPWSEALRQSLVSAGPERDKLRRRCELYTQNLLKRP
jgi:hypothetical protein